MAIYIHLFPLNSFRKYIADFNYVDPYDVEKQAELNHMIHAYVIIIA